MDFKRYAAEPEDGARRLRATRASAAALVGFGHVVSPVAREDMWRRSSSSTERNSPSRPRYTGWMVASSDVWPREMRGDGLINVNHKEKKEFVAVYMYPLSQEIQTKLWSSCECAISWNKSEPSDFPLECKHPISIVKLRFAKISPFKLSNDSKCTGTVPRLSRRKTLDQIEEITVVRLWGQLRSRRRPHVIFASSVGPDVVCAAVLGNPHPKLENGSQAHPNAVINGGPITQYLQVTSKESLAHAKLPMQAGMADFYFNTSIHSFLTSKPKPNTQCSETVLAKKLTSQARAVDPPAAGNPPPPWVSTFHLFVDSLSLCFYLNLEECLKILIFFSLHCYWSHSLSQPPPPVSPKTMLLTHNAKQNPHHIRGENA
ncbi:hypothetical protein ACLOJK_002081 [Asimina triloba]